MTRQINMVKIAIVFIGMLSAVPCSAQVSLVRSGEARAVVITANEPSKTTRYAVKELVTHLKDATGATLEVFPESETPSAPHTRVYIGETETSRHLGMDPERLSREAYMMRSVGNDLFIIGRDSEEDPLRQSNPNVGTLFGVYEFLQRYLGVRWLWPGEMGTYIPKTDTVEIWSVNETQEPALAFRQLRWGRIQSIAIGGRALSEEDALLGFSQEGAERYGKALQVLLRRHRLGGSDAKPPTGHAFSGWWQRHGKEHPEWFALRRDGTRGHPDADYNHVPMCITNKELQNYLVEQWDGESVLRLGPVDRPGRCTCAECRSWDGPQPKTPPWFAEGIYGKDHRAQELFAGATSDRYARFWKTIQEKAVKRNPHAQVSASFIYENEFPAPVTGIELNKNIYGEFVQWQDPHLRYFPMPDEAFQWIKQQWLGWRKTGIRMGYRPNYLHDGYVMPHFETKQSGEFFKFAYKHGMLGSDFDSLTGQWATQGLRLYMHLRLMTQPKLKIEEISDEYFSAFGPAAAIMERYFSYWEQYAFENQMRFVELYRDSGWRYRTYVRRVHEAFPEECFKPAEELLKQAMELTRDSRDPQFAQRVQFIQIGLDHARLTRRLAAIYDGEEQVPEEKVEKAKKALRKLVEFRKEHEHTFFSDLLHVTSFWERPHINLEPLMNVLNE